MIWTQLKQIGHTQNGWYWTKIIWTVQNHFGPIEGQGIYLRIILQHGISMYFKGGPIHIKNEFFQSIGMRYSSNKFKNYFFNLPAHLRKNFIINIDQCTKKETTLRVGHFTTISAYYINIFHKTGVQTNIVRCECLPCLDLNWIKSYGIKQSFSFSFQGFFNFLRKNENLPLINSHFPTISGHFSTSYIKIFHTTEVQKVILRCLVCLNLNWIKIYDIILLKNMFVMPENTLFQG